MHGRCAVPTAPGDLTGGVAPLTWASRLARQSHLSLSKTLPYLTPMFPQGGVARASSTSCPAARRPTPGHDGGDSGRTSSCLPGLTCHPQALAPSCHRRLLGRRPTAVARGDTDPGELNMKLWVGPGTAALQAQLSVPGPTQILKNMRGNRARPDTSRPLVGYLISLFLS